MGQHALAVHDGAVRILLPNHLASGAYELKTTLQDQQGRSATHVQQSMPAGSRTGKAAPLELICRPNG